MTRAMEAQLQRALATGIAFVPAPVTARDRAQVSALRASGDGSLADIFRAAAFLPASDVRVSAGLAHALERLAARALRAYRRAASGTSDDGDVLLDAELARLHARAAATVDLAARAHAGHPLGATAARRIERLARVADPLSEDELEELLGRLDAVADPASPADTASLTQAGIRARIAAAIWRGVAETTSGRLGYVRAVPALADRFSDFALCWIIEGMPVSEATALACREAAAAGRLVPVILAERFATAAAPAVLARVS